MVQCTTSRRCSRRPMGTGTSGAKLQRASSLGSFAFGTSTSAGWPGPFGSTFSLDELFPRKRPKPMANTTDIPTMSHRYVLSPITASNMVSVELCPFGSSDFGHYDLNVRSEEGGCCDLRYVAA